MQHIAHRIPGHVPDEFTRQTYALLEAYAADGEIQRPNDDYFVGDAGMIIYASDMLIERGTESWDACDADVVRAMFRGGFHVMAAQIASAVLAFRRWLSRTGRATPDGIPGLAQLAAEVADGAPPAVHAPNTNRSERRWRARVERRARRR